MAFECMRWRGRGGKGEGREPREEGSKPCAIKDIFVCSAAMGVAQQTTSPALCATIATSGSEGMCHIWA